MAPLDFLYHFRDQLREEGIRFAITSGMACVYYGLQQNTKDSDWIIHPEDIPKLRAMLEKKQRRVPPWRISYRAIFGAPLEEDYLAAGWTSHLSIWPSAGGPEQHVDIFGKPPRVPGLGLDTDEEGFATRETVAMMKRTDRDKDWPIVDGLGWQIADENDPFRAVTHVQNTARLLKLWANVPEDKRSVCIEIRPLLGLIETIDDPLELGGWIRLERLVREHVNRERYGLYTRTWKNFYRSWKKEEDWLWPTGGEFRNQHELLMRAVATHGLAVEPMSVADKEGLVRTGIEKAAKAGLTTLENALKVSPPIEIMLP